MALKLHCDLPSGLSCKESACQCRRCRFDPWVRGDPLEKGMATIPVFLPGKFQGGRSLVGYSPWGRKEADSIKHTLTHYLNQYAVYTAGGNLKGNPGSNP